MKFLYVGITRAKNRLFIYDDSIEDRKPIEQIWKKLDFCHTVNENALGKSKEELGEELYNLINKGTLADQKNEPEQWRIQGVRFLKQKFFS